jgi:S-adenosyl methyltransferase
VNGPWLDPRAPNVARVCDSLLGGKDNLPADRHAADLICQTAPDIPAALRENSWFAARAVRFLSDAGIAQFVEFGPGFPRSGSLHERARRHNPNTRVAYIDHDPVAARYQEALAGGQPGVAVLHGDLRDPGVLASPKLRAHIDLTRPVALILTLVVQHLTAEDDPCAILARLCGELAAGSFLAVSHFASDSRDPAAVAEITGAYQGATAPLVARSKDQIIALFGGCELTEPGVVFASEWRPELPICGTRWIYAAAGRIVGRRAGQIEGRTRM